MHGQVNCEYICMAGTEVESILWSEKFSPQTIVSILTISVAVCFTAMMLFFT